MIDSNGDTAGIILDIKRFARLLVEQHSLNPHSMTGFLLIGVSKYVTNRTQGGGERIGTRRFVQEDPAYGWDIQPESGNVPPIADLY